MEIYLAQRIAAWPKKKKVQMELSGSLRKEKYLSWQGVHLITGIIEILFILNTGGNKTHPVSKIKTITWRDPSIIYSTGNYTELDVQYIDELKIINR